LNNNPPSANLAKVSMVQNNLKASALPVLSTVYFISEKQKPTLKTLLP